MLLDELVSLLPKQAPPSVAWIALAGAVAGAGLWVAGSRISRGLMTLVAVTIGALVGLKLPAWCGWDIYGAGTAIAGALLLGVSGYLLHKAWVGIGLGAMLACWAAMAVWVLGNGTAEAQWAWPAIDRKASLWAYLTSVWKSLPPDVVRYLPWACGVAMVSGLATAILWPRTALVLMHSMLGVSLLVGLGLVALSYGRPQWLAKLPATSWVQLSALGGLLVAGALVQWWMSKPKVVVVAKRDEWE